MLAAIVLIILALALVGAFAPVGYRRRYGGPSLLGVLLVILLLVILL